jgi:hypothetical protein
MVIVTPLQELVTFPEHFKTSLWQQESMSHIQALISATAVDFNIC